MFNPQYVISPKLLNNIKRVTKLIINLNNLSFPKIVLKKLEKEALALSSHSSTRIEGNPLPLTEVKKILKNVPTNIRDSEKEVLNYNEALEYLNQLIDKNKTLLTPELILNIHTLVIKELLPAHELGKFRKQPVVVNDPVLRKVKYLAPNWKEVKKLIQELSGFINENQSILDPLILAGIFHKQFVIIHPFLDGNGRTTRLITKFILATLGINTFKLFSFENYYNQNISKYFDEVGLIGDYYELMSDVDFTKWLEYFTDGIIDELIRVTDQLQSKFRLSKIRLKPHEVKLLNYIKKHGSISDRDYANLTDRAKATRNQDFRRLISLKLINMIGKGKATYYILKNGMNYYLFSKPKIPLS